MAAVANACDLTPPSDGLAFPPCGVDDLAQVLRPRNDGGRLEVSGQVEVVSSLERDGSPVFRDLRWGVYVVFEATGDYAAACFCQYGVNTDSSGRYAAMHKPFHLIGLELNISVLLAGLLGRATGSTRSFRGDVVATAKRDLQTSEILDGEGGATVWGKLIPAARSLEISGIPIGPAHGAKVRRPIRTAEPISWNDVEIDLSGPAVEAAVKWKPGFPGSAVPQNDLTVRTRALPLSVPCLSPYETHCPQPARSGPLDTTG